MNGRIISIKHRSVKSHSISDGRECVLKLQCLSNHGKCVIEIESQTHRHGRHSDTSTIIFFHTLHRYCRRPRLDVFRCVTKIDFDYDWWPNRLSRGRADNRSIRSYSSTRSLHRVDPSIRCSWAISFWLRCSIRVGSVRRAVRSLRCRQDKNNTVQAASKRKVWTV